MNRRKIWVLILVLGLFLLVAGAGIVVRDVTQFQTSTRNELRAGCLRQATTFENFAEHWIVRSQLDALEASAKLVLMGSGLYIDVIVQGAILYSDQDEDLATKLIPAAIEPDTPIVEAESRTLPTGAIEVMVPIVLTGYPDSSIGVIRMAFSGDYANSKIRTYTHRMAGLGLAVWLGLMTGLVFLGWWIYSQLCPQEPSTLQCGTLQIDTRRCAVCLNGCAIELTPKLYEILLLFVQSSGSILSDQDILAAVWPDSVYAASADVKQHIYLLRRKLGSAHPDPKKVIVTMKGFGYRFDPPTNEDGLSAN